jgi:hypothetical protein
MGKRGGEIEALREMVRQASQEPTPDVDWERVERRLSEHVDESHRSRSRMRWVYALAAAAAVVLVSLGLLRSADEPVALEPALAPPAAAPRVMGPNVQGVVDGARLAIGDRVVSAASEVSVEHPGRGSWTLAASSSGALADSGERLTIRLESGAVLSRVVPSAKPESFAIVVGDVRVAVHGTVFRVERRGDQALVNVKEGVVAVGPAAAGKTEGWLLRAGDQGSFSLDGKTGTVQRAPTAQLSGAPAAAPALPRAAAKRSTPAAAPLPVAPSPGELEQGLDQVSNHVTRCFDDNTNSGDVRVTARTRVTTTVLPNGSIGSLSFDPPLAPDVERCAVGVQRAAKFPQSQQGAVVERTILLGP